MSSLETTAISRPQPLNSIPGYRLEKLVGAGGMGEVHKAIQLSLNRTVAVKLLSAQLASDESFVARFQKEAAALAALHHPNIVSIVDRGNAQSTYYLVMEFVDGPSLRERMREPDQDPLESLRVMLQICRAIEYAHNRGVIHRDLKPENILFDEQAGGIPKVTDFGLASFLDDASSRYNLTSTHVAMGTLSYMAPEQKVDAKSADGRADIFALGLILYEMLVGELPAGNFDPPSHRKPGLDPKLDGIIARCLKQTPADRYAKVGELIAELEPLVPQYTTVRPAKLSRWQRVKRWLGRMVRAFFQAVAILVVLAATGVLCVAWLRSTLHRVAMTPGTALTADLGPPSAQRVTGRVATVDGEPRRVSLGDGADSPQLIVSGRPLHLEEKTLVFPGVEGQSRVGLMHVDVQNMKGDTARLAARVSTEHAVPSFEARAHALLFGPPPEPKAALVLLGADQRYVALVYKGPGEPLELEWNLGAKHERQGTMLSTPLTSEGPLDLELTVDEEGIVLASVGSRENKRTIGEPLHLEEDWMDAFGAPPFPAFGCIEGICRADNFTYQVKKVTAKPAAASAPAPEPRQEPKRPAAKASPPSKGKRSK